MIDEKVAIIGLDGVPFLVTGNLFDAGLMPNLADIAKHGTFANDDVAACRFISGLDILYDRQKPW